MTLYDILKAARRKETANTDFMTVLRARSTAMYKGVTTVIKTITGSLPFTFNSTGANLAEWSLSGNMTQTGTPTPDSPIYPEECGNLVSDNYVLPIVCGGVTTTVYLGEVETERKIKKIDLGTLNWIKTQSGNFSADTTISDMKVVTNYQLNNALSDMFTEVAPDRVASTPYSFSSCLNGNQRPFVNSTGFENMSGAEFKEAMSGVYMYYVLATPTTGILNEPLRKIGTYADTISNAATIPTVRGSNTFDVSTTLKPSEATIKYYSADALRQLNITQGSKTKKKSTRKKGT